MLKWPSIRLRRRNHEGARLTSTEVVPQVVRTGTANAVNCSPRRQRTRSPMRTIRAQRRAANRRARVARRVNR